MSSLPEVRFANSAEQVTRLISGGNPLCGNSHFSPEMDEAMRGYFTAEQVVKHLHRLEASGINALQARGDYQTWLTPSGSRFQTSSRKMPSSWECFRSTRTRSP